MKVLAYSLGLVAALTHGSVALACGASNPPHYVVEEQSPRGGLAPLNTPLRVKVRESADGPNVAIFDPTLALTRAGSDEQLKLKPLGSAPLLRWVPLEALAPDTTYEAHFNTGYEGEPDAVWQFTTGTATALPLTLDGKLEVTLETGMDTTQTCPSTSTCGAGCVESAPFAVIKARVKLPRVSGGFARRDGVLQLTDDEPLDFSVPSKGAPAPYQGRNVRAVTYANLEDPSITEVFITLPEAETAYHPCFAYRAEDARGEQAATAPLCLTALFPTQDIGPDGLTDDSDADRQSLQTSAACSMQAGVSHQNAWWSVLGLLALRRRRRSRSAP